MNFSNYFKILKPTKTIYVLFVILGVLVAGGFNSHNFAEYILFLISYWLFYGALYAINDVFDYKLDRLDKIRSQRVIASGKISRRNAVIYSITLITITLAMFYYLDWEVFLLASCLLFINVTYALIVKKIAYVAMFYLGLSAVLKFSLGYVFESDISHLKNIDLILMAFYFVSIGFGVFKLIREIDFAQIRDTVIGKYTRIPLYTLQALVFIPLLYILVIATNYQKVIVIWTVIIYLLSLIIYYKKDLKMRDSLNKFSAIVSQGFFIDFNNIVQNTVDKINKAIVEIKENISK